jgi:hypothetical protein
VTTTCEVVIVDTAILANIIATWLILLLARSHPVVIFHGLDFSPNKYFDNGDIIKVTTRTENDQKYNLR